MGMANGARFIKGFVTAPLSDGSCIINFGVEFDKFLFYIEATNESKAVILSSGENANKAYGFAGVYPGISIDEYNNNYNMLALRINPSTKATTGGASSAGGTQTSISIPTRAITSAYANYMYYGLTYEYYIVEIK